MANTSALKEVSEYAITKAEKLLGTTLERKKVPIGTLGKLKTFDGVSENKSIIVKVLNHSGLTSGRNKPSAKIRSTFADCYFLSLTSYSRKILILTNQEFYKIFKEDSYGLLKDIEIMYIKLPDYYKSIASEVSTQASKEMSKI